MDLITQIIVACLIGVGSTIVTVKVVIAELKRDMEYAKEEITALKNERKTDIAELKQMVKENNEERKESLEKMDEKIDSMLAALNDLKLQIARK